MDRQGPGNVPPSPPCLIRLARSTEYSAIGELTALAYEDVLNDGTIDPYRDELLDAAARATAAELWVATDERDRLLGTVTIGRPGSPFAEIASPGEIEIRMLAIDPAHSRRGLGRELMAHVHALGAREGFDRAVLSVISTSNDTLRFYAALGYQPAPTRDWRPSEDLDLLLLVLTYSLRD